MSWVYGLAVHERAAADDRFDTELSARRERLGRDAAGPEGPVKPDALHAASSRLAHDGRANGRMSGDEDAVYLARDGRNTRVSAHAFELGRVGIDGNGLMPALLEATKDYVRGRATGARHARDHNALSGEEIGHGWRKAVHCS